MKQFVMLFVLLVCARLFGMDPKTQASKRGIDIEFYDFFLNVSKARQELTKLIIKKPRFAFEENKNSQHKILYQNLERNHAHAQVVFAKVLDEVNKCKKAKKRVSYKLFNLLINAIVLTEQFAFLRLDASYINFCFKKQSALEMKEAYEQHKKYVDELKESLVCSYNYLNKVYKKLCGDQSTINQPLTESKRGIELSESAINIMEDYVSSPKNK